MKKVKGIGQSKSGSSPLTWSVVAAWALGAVDGDVGLSTAREAIPTLWAIGARVQTVFTKLVCADNTLIAAFSSGMLVEASEAGDGVVSSSSGT